MVAVVVVVGLEGAAVAAAALVVVTAVAAAAGVVGAGTMQMRVHLEGAEAAGAQTMEAVVAEEWVGSLRVGGAVLHSPLRVRIPMHHACQTLDAERPGQNGTHL